MSCEQTNKPMMLINLEQLQQWTTCKQFKQPDEDRGIIVQQQTQSATLINVIMLFMCEPSVTDWWTRFESCCPCRPRGFRRWSRSCCLPMPLAVRRTARWWPLCYPPCVWPRWTRRSCRCLCTCIRSTDSAAAALPMLPSGWMSPQLWCDSSSFGSLRYKSRDWAATTSPQQAATRNWDKLIALISHFASPFCPRFSP